jgi:UDP-3-O-[3-hydroxymyristoyl] glucosamine N-acyltransferase
VPSADTVHLGDNVEIFQSLRMHDRSDAKIGAFVEIQKNAVIGGRCMISSHAFICESVSIEENAMGGCGEG